MKTLIFAFACLVLVNGAFGDESPKLSKDAVKTASIIDCHTHFKGEKQIAHESKTTKRDPKNTLGHVVKPEDYRALAKRLSIRSTLIVEAVEQDQPQFNDWVLEQAKSNLVCGYVARGDLLSDQFSDNYVRYRKSGYLKGYRFRFTELRDYLASDKARANLRTLEKDQMVVDLLVDPVHVEDVVALAKAFPKLKIVINHCFRARMKGDKIGDDWKAAMKKVASFPNVYCKLSSIVNFADVPPFGEQAPSNLSHYLPILEPTFSLFGEDRLIFGTNWGVCTHFGKVDDVVRIATEFLRSKGQAAFEKAMYKNAIRVYRIDEKHLPAKSTDKGSC